MSGKAWREGSEEGLMAGDTCQLRAHAARTMPRPLINAFHSSRLISLDSAPAFGKALETPVKMLRCQK